MKKWQRRIFRYGKLPALVILSVMAGGCGKISLITETETELREGQRKAEITVVSITGNELTYIELEEETQAGGEAAEAESKAAAEEAGAEGKAAAEKTATGAMKEAPEETAEETAAGAMKEAPEETAAGTARETEKEAGTEADSQEDRKADSGTEEKTDFRDEPREDSGGMDRTEGNERFNMGQRGFGEMPDMSGADLGETSAAITVYLPVAVAVYTDTGKKMTFSILQAGDELEVLFETDENGNEVITEIRMTGTGG